MQSVVLGVVTSVQIRCESFEIAIFVRTREDVIISEVYIRMAEAAFAQTLPPLAGSVSEQTISVEIVAGIDRNSTGANLACMDMYL